MRLKVLRVQHIMLLTVLMLNVFALMINFNSVLEGEVEGFTADLLRGFGVPIHNEDQSESVIPKLTTESLNKIDERNQVNSFPITTSKIVNSFSLPSWGGLGFGFRKNITIDSTKVPTDLTNFPLLIDMKDAPDIFGVTQASGKDIIFTDSSGTILDHEIELFDDDTYHLVAWVRIPSLSSSLDTRISMYYGNETIGTQQNPSGVWDNDYMAVYHLNDNPSSTIYDSTSNDNDGSSYGSVIQEEGLMGNAYYFDQQGGTNDYLQIPQSTSLNLVGNQMTLEGWVYLQFTPVLHDSMVFDKAGDFYNTDGWMMGVDGEYVSGGVGYPTRLNQRLNTQNNQAIRTDNGAIYPGQWTYLTVVYNGITTSYTGYIDASSVYNNPSISGNIRPVDMDLFIGKRDEAANRVFYGSMDELRISNTTRSTGYITTCYNNYNDPDSFYSISPQEPSFSLFEKQRTLTIDSSIVAGGSDLTNFPLLLNLYLENASQNVLFQDASTSQTLDYEIEHFDAEYNTSHGRLVVWVKIPILSSTVDTEIIMFTDSTIAPVTSNTNIWKGYRGVWHLSESVVDESSANNVYFDATGEGSLGNQHGSDDSGSSLGKGASFDGTNDYIEMGSPNILNLNDSTDSGGIDQVFTLSGWFYRDTTGTIDVIVDKSQDGTYPNILTGYMAYIDSDNRFNFRLMDDDDDGYKMISASTYTNPGWHHFAATFDTCGGGGIFTESVNWKLLIDGVDDTGTKGSWGPGGGAWEWINGYLPNDGYFTIGANSNNSNYFDGLIDEIRLIDSTLSPDWIATEYRNAYNLSSYLSISPEIESQRLWHDDSFARRKDLQIDSSGFQDANNEHHIILRPGARGTDYNQWGVSGANYRHAAVEEVIADGWTTYITHSSNNTYLREMFYAVGLPPTTPSGTITSVRIYSTARTSGVVSSYAFQHYVRVGGSNQWFGSRGLSGSWIKDYDEQTTNPVTSQPWTWQDLVDFEFGVRAQVVEGASAGYIRVTQVYAVVSYIPDSSSLENFPIYLDIDDSDLKTDVQANGNDICFYDEYGMFLAHEIVEFDQNFNSTHAHLSAWIEIPTLSTGGDSYITMYYGNSTLSSQERASETWEDFLAVYHLEEAPTGPVLDSTSNNLDLTSSGTMTTGDLVVGQIGSSIDFDGINDQLFTTQVVSIGSFTISTWVYFDAGVGWNTIVNFDRSISDYRQFAVQDWDPRFDGAGYSYPFGGPYSISTWYHLAFSYDANTTEFNVYVNGALSGPTRYLNIPDLSDDFQLGAWGTGDWWDGKLDEIRIATEKRSEAWIKAEFANQENPSTFITMGQEVELLPPTVNSFGVDDPGNGNPTFWANITDHDSSVSFVSFRVNSSDEMMSKNASGIWTYQLPSVNYGDYYTYQVTNASDLNGNYLSTASIIRDVTFDYDTVLPTVLDWDYDPYKGVNGTFNANVSDSWGTVNTVMVNVTAHDNMGDLSGLWGIMRYTPGGYVNDTIKMLSGTISFVVTVTDIRGNSFTSTEHVSIVINHAPSIENVLLSRDISNETLLPVYSNSTAIYLHYDFNDVDGDSQSGTQIRWYKWNDTAWVQQGAYDDTTQVPRTALIKNAIWRVSVRPRDGIDFGTTVYSDNITIENTVPLIRDPILSPTNPKTGNDLTVSYTWIDADALDTDQSLIQWYRDNGSGYYLLDSYTNDTLLPSSVTIKGDKWRVNVTASDGDGFGNWIVTLEIIILNTAPTLDVDINNKTIPSTVDVNDDLVANYTYYDADGDSESSVEYQWLKFNTTSNDFEIFTTGVDNISYTNTIAGELWRVEIRVSDGTNTSGWVTSATMSIGVAPNNPPSAININLTLSNAVAGGFLYISYTFTDPNGDNETISLYRWYRNSVYQPQFDGYRNLTSASLVKGDSWYAEVRPRDELDYGNWSQSTVIVIGNTVPTVTSTEIFPSGDAFTTNVLVANYETSDVDGDTIVDYKIVWNKYNGTSYEITSLENETEVPGSSTSKGDIWTFEVFIYDGTDWSLGVTSLQKQIRNSEPTITDISLSGGENSSRNITLSYKFVDLDNDTESGTSITWWIISGTGPTQIPNDQLALIFTSFVAGDLVYAAITPDDGSGSTGLFLTIGLSNGLIIVGNSAPTLDDAPNILGPNDSTSFTAGFPIYVNYSASDPDHGEADAIYDIELDGDGYVVGAEYQWYRNDLLVATLTGPTVPTDYLSKGDNWMVRVKPRDRYGYFGDWINSSLIVIANSNPEISGVEFITTYLTTIIDIRVQFTYSDIDGDPIQTENTSILWYRNGILILGTENRTVVSSELIGDSYLVIITLNSINYQKNDNISVTVQPFDGTDWSTTSSTSSEITVQNSLPTVSNLNLLPHNRSGTIIYTTDQINLSWVYFDHDGDNESSPIIIWERNDVIQGLYNNSWFIPSVATAKDEKWDVIIQTFDGTSYSVGLSITIIITNSIPTLTDVILENNEGLTNITYADNGISIDYIYTDADFDSVDENSGFIQWYRNGVHVSVLDNQTSISGSELVKGDNWYAVVQILDRGGVVWSNNRTSQTIFVVNKAPEVISILILEELNQLIEDENLTLILTITDPDINDTDASLIEWLKDGMIQPQFTNQIGISYLDTSPGETWTIRITPSDGIDSGVIRNKSYFIQSRPYIQDLTTIVEQDTDGHFTFGLQVVDALNAITSVRYRVFLNGSALPEIVDTLNSPNATDFWNLDYILSDPAYYNTELLIEVLATSVQDIWDLRFFHFTIIDGVAPRISTATSLGVWFEKNSDDPTHLSFFAEIEEYGAGVANVTLYYYYDPVEAGEGSASVQDFTSILMTFNKSTGATLTYAVTVPYPQDQTDYEILYWVATQDMDGNSNPVAFDIRNYPERISNEKIIQLTMGGLPEEVLFIAGAAVLLIFVGAVVYVRFIRKPEIIGLDKELVMKGVPGVGDEKVFADIDRHTLGLVVSFFDQLHGPIPIIVIPEMLKDNYSKLVALSDRSFSGTGFSDDYTSEVHSSYDFVLAEKLRISVMSYGFALDKPDARGGQENLTLNILVHQDIFNLIEQFKDEIQEKVHEFHMTMAGDSSNKTLIRVKANEVRKYVSAIVLSYVDIYGTTELIKEDEE